MVDFQIISQILYLANLTNQMRKQQRAADILLEKNLLTFAKIFKTYVLTDSRILMLCADLYEEQHAPAADSKQKTDQSKFYGGEQEQEESIQMLA